MLCEWVHAGSRNNHRLTAKVKRFVFIPHQPQSLKPIPEAHKWGHRHHYPWSMIEDHWPSVYTYLSKVRSGTGFTTMLWCSLCFYDLLQGQEPSVCLWFYWTPMLSIHRCISFQTDRIYTAVGTIYVLFYITAHQNLCIPSCKVTLERITILIAILVLLTHSFQQVSTGELWTSQVLYRRFFFSGDFFVHFVHLLLHCMLHWMLHCSFHQPQLTQKIIFCYEITTWVSHQFTLHGIHRASAIAS